MAERTATWYLIQFTGDMRRREPRNVGIVLQSSQGWRSKFIAETAAGIDGRKLRALGVTKDVYETWLGYYRRHMSDEGWDRALNRKKRGNFSALLGGHSFEGNSDWSVELERLYTELVETPSPEDREPVVDVAARLLRAARINAEADFEIFADYGRHRTDTVRWDFAYQNGSLHLMDSLRLGGWTAQVQAEAFHARANAVMSGAHHTPLRFVCFYDSVDPDGLSTDHLLTPIEAVGTAIDVSHEERALDTLSSALRS